MANSVTTLPMGSLLEDFTGFEIDNARVGSPPLKNLPLEIAVAIDFSADQLT